MIYRGEKIMTTYIVTTNGLVLSTEMIEILKGKDEE